MDITALIRELLFSHDCVIVPGFGGFIGNYTPAHIDKATSTFYPPVKQISFNRNLNNNDGLLIGRVSESLKFNYADSRNLVDSFVVSLVKRLEKGEKIIFDSIGTLYNNQEGNVQFEPDRNVNYHLDSYGLDPFQFPPVEGYDVRKRITGTIRDKNIRSYPVRKILWRAAVIIPLLSVLVAVSLKTDLFRSKVETTNLNPLVNAEFESNKKALDEKILLPSESPEVTDNEPLSSVSSEALSDFSSISGSVNTPDVNQGDYCLITGSFRSKLNADSQVEVLKENGFSPEIMIAPNGFYRVCAMRCNDLTTAIGKKDSLTKEFAGTWVNKI